MRVDDVAGNIRLAPLHERVSQQLCPLRGNGSRLAVGAWQVWGK